MICECVNCGFRKKAHGNLKEKGWCDNFRYCPYPYCEGECPQCSSTNSPSNDLRVKGGGNPPAGRKGCGKPLISEGDTWGICGEECVRCGNHLCKECEDET